ncbi:uncharacterized protein LOC132757860 isoform X2 [Ruditapes philippinarum]|uniref:uncharacterized protein LOC132757860 isoform X2 n=1 Tax=Ruditapes philippinarum TaxID=129788 RepID=UPI00295AE62A|nr:uncharacterized protein LOC132757860 isoform X2 [Ruditapes philippinarum]
MRNIYYHITVKYLKKKYYLLYSYRGDLRNKQGEITQLEERLKSIQQDNCKKDKDRENIYKMTLKIDSLKNELERTKQEKIDRLTSYKKELQRKESVITKLEQCLESIQQDNCKTKKDIEESYKRELQSKANEITQLEERLKSVQQDNCKKEKDMEESYTRRLRNQFNQISKMQEQMKIVEKDHYEKESEWRKRLSALPAKILTGGYANIADLSDVNRPTKLSEKYTELYDNQWRDAFTYLSSNEKKGEEEICSLLVHAFCSIYSTCRRKADADLKAFIYATDELFEADDRAREIIKTAKIRRNERPRIKVEVIKQLYTSDMQENIPVEEQKGIEPFIR